MTANQSIVRKHTLVDLPEPIREEHHGGEYDFTSVYKYECSTCGERYQKRINPSQGRCVIEWIEIVDRTAREIGVSKASGPERPKLDAVLKQRFRWKIYERTRFMDEWNRWSAWKVSTIDETLIGNKPLMMACPTCGVEQEDHDGFGVQHCEACGFCTHASVDGVVCGLCGADVSAPASDNRPTGVLVVPRVALEYNDGRRDGRENKPYRADLRLGENADAYKRGFDDGVNERVVVDQGITESITIPEVDYDTSETCTTCHAKPGEPCLPQSAARGPRKFPHPARVSLAPTKAPESEPVTEVATEHPKPKRRRRGAARHASVTTTAGCINRCPLCRKTELQPMQVVCTICRPVR